MLLRRDLHRGDGPHTHLVEQRPHLAPRQPGAVGRRIQEPEGGVGRRLCRRPVDLGGPHDGVGPEGDVLTLEFLDHGLIGVGQARQVSSLDNDQLRVLDGEFDVPPDELVESVCSRHRGVHPPRAFREESLADSDEKFGQYGVLRGEVVVEGRARDSQVSSDLVDGDAVESLSREPDLRDPQDLISATRHYEQSSARDLVRTKLDLNDD